MSGRESQAMENALRLVIRGGYAVVPAAKEAGVHPTSLRRALTRHGVAVKKQKPGRKPRSGVR